ncbi:alpha/beta hydrolase fold domain-containing protein [Microbacterium sp. NPDC056044]|uniref:alpha/beta hydrolase fold domain-containing protein n=1 Tax=Microbacterium sp. NPDC056044 TaxID=3345690 RepID=UPI0035E12A5B
MPLDPYLASKLHLMENLDFHHMDEDMAARMAEFYVDPEPWTVPEGLQISDATVGGPHGPIPVRIYRPDTTADRVLVWAHGGGFAAGNLDMLEAHMVAAELAHRAGIVTVSVDYRLAQDGVRYPVPVDEVHAVVVAALEGSIPSVSRADWVAVGGASAGAALALAVAQRLRDGGGSGAAAVLLAYPLAHFPNPGLSVEIAADLAILPAALRTPASNVEWMVDNYVGRITDIPTDAIPGGGVLTGLPPATIVVSEYDDLRSSAELLERQFDESGVPVTTYLAAGMVHGHLNRGTVLTEVDRSLDFLVGALHG